MSDRTRNSEDQKEDVLTRERVKEPKKFKVILLNDDYTTMEFVVWVLMQIFRHSQAQATRIMLHIHNKGQGIAGVYSREVAETRVAQVEQVAKEHGHPLQCTMEPE